jgi:hypothetical protein
MEERIDPSARIVTDELNAYPPAVKGFTGGHETVCHSREEYVNDRGFHTNTVESWFALLKRGVMGQFHHVSKKHLHRYCDEFSFRWSERTVTDSERREQAIKQVEGKRLMYRQPVAVDSPENPVDGRGAARRRSEREVRCWACSSSHRLRSRRISFFLRLQARHIGCRWRRRSRSLPNHLET